MLLFVACTFIPESDLRARLDADSDGVSVVVDCDDKDPTVTTPPVWYADADQDGAGDPGVTTEACSPGPGWADNAEDCDDTAPERHPGAPEEDCTDPVDYNCDGSVAWQDEDGDGWVACEECDDGAAEVNPAAVEHCDGVDEDCDGDVDGGAVDASVWYADADGDGHGDATSSTSACTAPDAAVANDTDCDDGDATIHPGVVEACNTLDDDCDGNTDEAGATGEATWYADDDGDGHGDSERSSLACVAPAGHVADATDCDDTQGAVHPGATEACNADDDDCDGDVDEAGATGELTWYTDTDGDGYGDAASTRVACDQPAGYTSDGQDCDDTDGDTSPDGAELCDGRDNDCSGGADDGALDASTWYADTDADGYGDATATVVACDVPSGHVANAADCDDGATTISPIAVETCNGVDDDCDGAEDEPGASGEAIWYIDVDGDGYGLATATATACDAPAGYSALDTDCDDDDSSVHPGAAELADCVDNDCDSGTDDGAVASGEVIFTEITRQPRVGSSSTNTNAEWFELYNTSSRDIELCEWYIQRSSTTIAPDGFYVDPSDGVILPAGGFALFCKTDNYTIDSTSYSTMPGCDYYWGNESEASSYSSTYEDNTFNIQRDEDALSVFQGGDATTGTLIDQVAWTYNATDGYWPRESSRSMQLSSDALDHVSNDAIDSWCAVTNNVYYQWYYVSSSNREYGTPASANHVCP